MAVTGNTNGLVPQLMTRLQSMSSRLGKDVHVYSGKRNGPIDDSAHNTGIAADVQVAGLTSVAIADELVTEGFRGVGEYYRLNGAEWSTAHGDIRGLPGSENSGKYAPGGSHSGPACWTGRGDPPAEPPTTSGRASGHPCPQ